MELLNLTNRFSWGNLYIFSSPLPSLPVPSSAQPIHATIVSSANLSKVSDLSASFSPFISIYVPEHLCLTVYPVSIPCFICSSFVILYFLFLYLFTSSLPHFTFFRNTHELHSSVCAWRWSCCCLSFLCSFTGSGGRLELIESSLIHLDRQTKNSTIHIF